MEKQKVLKNFAIIDINEISIACASKKAVFFDMDGTLINSEPLHYMAITKLYHDSRPIKEDEIYGLSDLDVFNKLNLSQWFEFDSFLSKKNKIIIKTLSNTISGAILKKEIIPMLEALKNQGLELVLVTASERDVTDALLSSHSLDKYFTHTITRQDVEHTKPHPAPYQLALKMINIDKSDAIIFEDSETGISSALASGIDTIRVSWYK